MNSVYEITSPQTPRRYIGMSSQTKTRWCHHLYLSATDKRAPLYDSMREIGPQHFTFSVIASYPSRADAAAHEAGLIRFLHEAGHNPFNLACSGTGVLRPFNPDDPLLVETCKRINAGGGLMAWCAANRADPTAISRYVNAKRKAPKRLFEILKVSRSQHYAEAALREKG